MTHIHFLSAKNATLHAAGNIAVMRPAFYASLATDTAGRTALLSWVWLSAWHEKLCRACHDAHGIDINSKWEWDALLCKTVFGNGDITTTTILGPHSITAYPRSI